MITTIEPASASGETAGDPPSSVRWRGRARWVGLGLIGSGLALIPWLFVLAVGLPASTTAAHWSTAWVGLDGLEALGLITTGVLLNRRDPRRCLAATVTATLLTVDAWFDVTTAAPGADRATAVAMAAGLELPLAILCAVLAVRTLPRTGDLVVQAGVQVALLGQEGDELRRSPGRPVV
ncbi:hypothetical protein GCM10023191_003740 [Actinoallomurus oryzae]|uniref:Uncharacterized protein n=1 Tax=Actinoallomurus oryzae TaxID=502180 RepID=A0ABP8PA47_9ACTN